MADRSFKEYIGSRFYDQFFNAIKSYVIQNRHNIELSSRTVSSADYAELSDFTIKFMVNLDYLFRSSYMSV